MANWRNNGGGLGCVWYALFVLLCAGIASGETKNSCLDCHSLLSDPYGVTEEKFSEDVHAQKGLTCASCHGGDPTSDDPDKAMSRKAGWKGKIDRKQIPQLCGSCHSNPAYIRQYNPSLRTDQLDQYHTSVHGKRLAAGDTKVAVCTDCHSVHDLKAPSDPRSTVNPVNVANTCARCHADANYMKGYSIPTDQFAKYSTSIHHDALAVRGDLSAPTCTTCHGNHGAAPPGVDKVQNVCSTCHVFQAQMYEKSSHKEAFKTASLPGCVVCHSNQAIKSADHVLSVAESSGMEVSEARLAQSQSRDSLTKARVAIHSFRKDLVDQDIQSGLDVAAKNLQAGQKAMTERRYRRLGLGVSLLAIALMLVGLRLYIKRIESDNSHAS